VKRLLLLSALAYGVWTLIKAARQRQASEDFETTAYGPTPSQS
jgi:hypothetical protein